MSQENVEIVRRVYDAAAQRDSDAVLALYDPEVEVETTRGRGVASGAAVEPHQCGIWTLRAGRIVRVEWLEATREEALEAAGLRE